MNNDFFIWNTISERIDEIVDLAPSNLGRLSLTSSLIRAFKLDIACDIVVVSDATEKELTSFHGRGFASELLKQRQDTSSSESVEDSNEIHLQNERYGLLHDCPTFPNLDRYVRTVAGSSISAARKLNNEPNCGLISINWYGGRHHSHKNRASGFCYVNDIVLAINMLRRKFRKVFYLDLDIHHGDGVESAFEHSSSVITCSIHRYELGFFPGTGGIGSNTSSKVNIPTHKGLKDDKLMQIVEQIVIPIIQKSVPDVFVVQLGCDGLATDPQLEWNLTIQGVGKVIDKLLKVTRPKPILFLGGGGYNHTEAAKFWTYMTGLLVGIDTVKNAAEIPDHEHLENYEEDGYLFWTPKNLHPKNISDRNTENYIQELEAIIMKNFE